MSLRAVDNGQGVLIIRNIREEDLGTYTCTGSNFFGIDTDKAVVSAGG